MNIQLHKKVIVIFLIIYLSVSIPFYAHYEIAEKTIRIKYNNSTWVYDYEIDEDGVRSSKFKNMQKKVLYWSKHGYDLHFLKPKIIHIDSTDSHSYIKWKLKEKHLDTLNAVLLNYKFMSCGFGDTEMVLVKQSKNELIFESIDGFYGIYRVVFKRKKI